MAAGYVIYDGPSMLDGERIIVVVTGLAGSRNQKTGKMVQTYIIRPDMHPLEAVRTGADRSICGDCVHRGDGTGKGRSCYVTLIHGPRNVWQSYQRGVYPAATAAEVAEIVAGKMIRLGTYGDPAAAPLALWETLLAKAEGWTGYSHQFRKIDRAWSRLVMASADSPKDAAEAQLLGYRTFRVGATPLKREVLCPASEEAGKKTMCIACKACMGNGAKAKANVYIPPHGAGAAHFNRRLAA